MTGQEIRQALLLAINELSNSSPDSLQSNSILGLAARKLQLRDNLEMEQTLLTMWHDLFRQGMIAWGYNISNSEPPFCHLTEQGRNILGHMSRDPSNPDGYMAHIKSNRALNAIAASYLSEALQTFNSGCVKATAVMVGGAAESLILDLRDVLIKKLATLDQLAPRPLADWRVKVILDSVQKVLEPKIRSMPHGIAESYQSYWTAFTQQIRSVRNDAGHPMSVDPVTYESVHASLLIFPELVKLASDLKSWIENDMC